MKLFLCAAVGGGAARIPGRLSVRWCGAQEFADCITVGESVTGVRLGCRRDLGWGRDRN